MVALPTFPFLKLSPDLQEAIARKLNLLDLFSLSQCSKKSFDLVRSAQLKSQTPLGLCIVLEHMKLIRLSYLNRDFYTNFVIHLYRRRDPHGLDLVNPKPYRVDGLARTIDLCYDPREPGVFRCVHDLSSSELLLVITQIMELFNAKVNSLIIDSRHMDCLLGLLSMGALIGCDDVMIEDGRVTHEEMAMILEGVQAKNLMFLCKTDKGFSYDKKITADYFELNDDSWINLINLDCKQIALSSCGLTNQDLNRFIRHWLNGIDKKLEYLSHRTDNNYDEDEKNDADLTEIVKGLPTIPGTPKRRDATSHTESCLYRVAYENGFDFKRPSDEMLASVAVPQIKTQSTRNTHFVFVVWHDPNPYLVAP